MGISKPQAASYPFVFLCSPRAVKSHTGHVSVRPMLVSSTAIDDSLDAKAAESFGSAAHAPDFHLFSEPSNVNRRWLLRRVLVGLR